MITYMTKTKSFILLFCMLAAACVHAEQTLDGPTSTLTEDTDERRDEDQDPAASMDPIAIPSMGAGDFWDYFDPDAEFSDDPNAVLGAFEIAPGFEVNLFASEPMIENPIQMAWDNAGRLWVVCSPTYPQLDPGQEYSDYIAVLEDTDGDGQADRRTIFADGLLVPTGIEFGDGGVYIANVPDLLFLADTDGDLKADIRQTVLSGFGTEDNHQAISAFVWGPGGNLYFGSGRFVRTQVETPYGVVRADDGVVFEFQPRKRKLDRYVYGGSINHWGHNFDRWGQDFQTDGAWEGIWWLAPGQVPIHARERVPSAANIDTSTAGSEIVSGSHLPEDMQGILVMNDFRPRTVERHRLIDDGAGFRSTEILPPLIVSSEEYFRPVDVKMGPDGAIYVLDWHNALIGHLQYGFRDSRRDHTHGRVWRITAKDRPLVAKPRIADAPIAQLLENLKASENYTRHKSRRELYDRDAREVASALAGWVAALDIDDAGYELNRLEALWTYQTIDLVEPDLLRAVMQSEEPRARAAATRVLRYWREEIPDTLELLEAQVGDEHPRVRLEAVVALGHLRSARSIEVATRALDRPMDRHLEYSLRLVANALESVWLPAYEAGELRFNGNAAHEAFAVEALRSEGAVKPLLDLLRTGQIPASRRTAVTVRIINEGTPDALSELFRLSFEEFDRFDAAALAEILAAFTDAARHRGVIPPSDPEGFSPWNLEQIEKLLDHNDSLVRHELIRLLGAWKLSGKREMLERLARRGSAGERVAAIDAVAYLGGQQSIDYLANLSAPGNEVAVRAAAVSGLAILDLSLAASRAADVLASDPGLDPIPLLDPFLEMRGGAEALGSVLATVEIPEDVAKRALRHVNAVGRQEPELVNALLEWANMFVPVTDLSDSEMSAMVQEVETQGNAARGESVFRRTDLTCFNCHAISGGGSNLGPDLNAVGTSSPLDYIIEAILMPNKIIKEDYVAVAITTTTGMFHVGIVQNRNEDEITLRDALRDDIVISSELVDEIRETSSLMPTGLTSSLTHDELLDLVRFLSELGKPGPYASSDVPLARRWRVLASLPKEFAEASAQDLDAIVADNETLAWIPAYSTVAGVLPVDDLVPLGSDAVAYATTQVDVSNGGNLTLKLNASRGLTLWIDGNRVPGDDEVLLEWGLGMHSVTFGIDLSTRGDMGLRAEFGTAAGSSAQFQVLGGR